MQPLVSWGMLFIESLVLVKLSAKQQLHNFPPKTPEIPTPQRTIVELFTHGLFHTTKIKKKQQLQCTRATGNLQHATAIAVATATCLMPKHTFVEFPEK